MTTPGGSSGLKLVRGLTSFGSAVVRERFARRPATTLADIPNVADQVTGDWLTAVLCAEHPGAAVESFKAEDVSVGTSSRWRASVVYNEAGTAAGLPANLFAKTSATLSQRMLLGLVDVLENEPGFYRYIRPHLEIEAPHGYHGVADKASGRSIALMEDIVATKQITFCTPQTPISRAEIEDLLADMAVWHGKHWNDPRLAEYEWMQQPKDFVGKITQFAGLRKRSIVGTKRAEAVLPDGITAIHEDLFNALPHAMELASQGPLTLVHGDSHVGNVYKTAAGKMGFGDWQVVMRGNWSYDFSYLVSSALTVEDRRNWDEELLTFYLGKLKEAGGEAPEFDAAWLAYRQQMFWPYFGWLLSMGRSAVQPKFQPDSTSLGIIERASHAMMDLDSLAAVTKA